MSKAIARAWVMLACALALVITLTVAGSGSSQHRTLVAFDPALGQLPGGVALDAGGNLFVSLVTLGQIVRIPAGSVEPEPFARVEGLAAGESGPTGLAIDAEGNLYGGVESSNQDANGLWRFDAETGIAQRIPGSADIGFARDVAIAPDGVLYATDSSTGAVWRALPGGAAEPWIQGGLLEGTGEVGFGAPSGANGIAVEGESVYVAVAGQAHVVEVPVEADGSAGVPELFAQLPEAVDGIAFDTMGDLISTHPMANLITRRTPDGTIETVADVDDGLDRPSTVALHVNGDGSTTMYVANSSEAMGTELGHGPSILAIELDAASAPGSGPASNVAEQPPSEITISAGDLWFDPNELSVDADGVTTLTLVGAGKVAHNLMIDDLGVALSVGPGTTSSVTLVDPPPGTYTFYCAIFGHRKAGMFGTLTVE